MQKLTVAEMIPEKLKAVPDQELLSLNHRLHQLYGANFDGNSRMTSGDLNREDLVNAALFVWAEMERRGFEVDASTALHREAAHLSKADDEDLEREEAYEAASTAFWEKDEEGATPAAPVVDGDVPEEVSLGEDQSDWAFVSGGETDATVDPAKDG